MHAPTLKENNDDFNCRMSINEHVWEIFANSSNFLVKWMNKIYVSEYQIHINQIEYMK